MRPLAIVCESKHADGVRQSLRRLCHPQLHDSFCLVIGVDPDSGSYKNELELFCHWALNPPVGWTERALVVYAHEAARPLSLAGLIRSFGLEGKVLNGGSLIKRGSGQKSGTTPLEGILNQCGLSLGAASALLLRQWGHSSIDRNVIDNWMQQFRRLGAKPFLAPALLGSVRLYDLASLGNLLLGLDVPGDYAPCVNVDPRGNSKSGDVVRNILTKRHEGRQIGGSLAKLLEVENASRVVIYEDGLWSGTEAIGIFESLLGLRSGNEKTDSLKDPDLLRRVEVVLAYGVGTDYGRALLSRFLSDHGLPNVSISIGETISVSSDPLLTKLKDQPLNWEKIRMMGPEPGELQPYVIERFAGSHIEAADRDQAKAFLRELGTDLWVPYNENMAKNIPSWKPWPLERRSRAGLGQHGLGLAHGFSHSIPKASLPIFWYGGDVRVGGKTVRWNPLFRNAA